MSAPRWVCSSGGCLLWGVSAPRGVSAPGGVSASGMGGACYRGVSAPGRCLLQGWGVSAAGGVSASGLGGVYPSMQ